MIALPQDHTSRTADGSCTSDGPRSPRTIAVAFAAAIGTRDWAALAPLLHPEIDFRGLTPARSWLATGPDQVTDIFRAWALVEGRSNALDGLSIDTLAERHRLSYRLTLETDSPMTQRVCEHTAYFDLDGDALITLLRMLSSGACAISHA